MPNYVDCELDVEGDRVELERLVKMAHTDEKGDPEVDKADLLAKLDGKEIDPTHVPHEAATDLDFSKFVPEPVSVTDTHGQSGMFPRWYTWRIENWGTKWNACGREYGKGPEVILRKSVPKARFNFMTAWEPPMPVIVAMSKAFPTLTFTLRYWEHGMCFQGRLVVKGGEVREEWRGKYTGMRGG